MKILHTADWHVGAALRGRKRLDEHREVLEEVVRLADEQDVDLVIVAGDLFHHAAPAPDAEQVVYEALLGLAQEKRQVAVIAGNHDSPSRLEAVRPLLGLASITTVGHIRRPENGGTVAVTTRKGELVRIAMLPFLSQRGIVRADDLMSGDAAEHTQKYAERCRIIINYLCSGFVDDAVNLLLGHLTVVGGKAGGGEREAHSIFDYHVPPQVFPVEAHYVVLTV
jgi:exonuclease SbcD